MYQELPITMNKVHQLVPLHLQVAHQRKDITLRQELAELKATMQQLIGQIQANRDVKVSPPLNISTKNGKLIVTREAIIYGQALGNYTRIFVCRQRHSNIISGEAEFDDGKLASYLLSKTLKQTSQLINDPSFIRCHQSFLVNSIYVTALTKTEIVLITKNRIPIARRRKRAVLQHFSSANKLKPTD